MDNNSVKVIGKGYGCLYPESSTAEKIFNICSRYFDPRTLVVPEKMHLTLMYDRRNPEIVVLKLSSTEVLSPISVVLI